MINYVIMQLPVNHDRCFMSYKEGKNPDLGDYCAVWQGTFEEDFDLNDQELVNHNLESLFHVFNNVFPKNFAGRSMSTSDLIIFYTEGIKKAYYCNDFGWEEVPEFFK